MERLGPFPDRETSERGKEYSPNCERRKSLCSSRYLARNIGEGRPGGSTRKGWVSLQVAYREVVDAKAKTGARNASLHKLLFQGDVRVRHLPSENTSTARGAHTSAFSIYQSRGQDILSPTAMCRWKAQIRRTPMGRDMVLRLLVGTIDEIRTTRPTVA